MAVGAWEGHWVWKGNLRGGLAALRLQPLTWSQCWPEAPCLLSSPAPTPDLLAGGLSFSKKMEKTSKIVL